MSICWPDCELQKAISCQQPGHLCSHAVTCLSWASATTSARKADIESETCARAILFPDSLSLLSLQWVSLASRGTDGKTQGRRTNTQSCLSGHLVKPDREESHAGQFSSPYGRHLNQPGDFGPKVFSLWGLWTGPMRTDWGVGSLQHHPESEERKIPPSIATSLQVLHTLCSRISLHSTWALPAVFKSSAAVAFILFLQLVF